MTWHDMAIRCEGMRHSTVCQNNCIALNYSTLHGAWRYRVNPVMTWSDRSEMTWHDMTWQHDVCEVSLNCLPESLHVYFTVLYCTVFDSIVSILTCKMKWLTLTWLTLTWLYDMKGCVTQLYARVLALHCTTLRCTCLAVTYTVHPVHPWHDLRWHDLRWHDLTIRRDVILNSTVCQSHCTALHVYFTVLHCTVFDSTVSILSWHDLRWYDLLWHDYTMWRDASLNCMPE